MTSEQTEPQWWTDTRTELDGLAATPLSDQPVVFDRIHQRLAAALATTGEGGRAVPPARPGH